jgi:hypothetical protein
MKNAPQLKVQIETEDDFIYCPKYDNSMQNLLQHHPEGLEIDRIAKVLLMTTEEAEELYNNILKKLRKNMDDPTTLAGELMHNAWLKQQAEDFNK